MAANQYYNQYHSPNIPSDQEHLLSQSASSPGLSSGHPSPLRPLHLVTNIEHNHGYHHGPNIYHDEQLQSATYEDASLKARIRHLRVYSRILALLISIAVLVPITMTLTKFLTTQNTYRIVTTPTGQVTRTAWARKTRAWPTWAYFGVALASVVLNFGTVFAYRFGVEKANTASYITSTFSWVVMLGNLVVWGVAAGMYRREKDRGGRHDDLWGWTCSAAARAIQKEFAGEVDFDRYCDVQSISWYIGLLQVGAALLTVVIYIFVLMRRKSKKQVKQQLRMSGFEAPRH